MKTVSADKKLAFTERQTIEANLAREMNKYEQK